MDATAETDVYIEIRRRTGTLQYRIQIHLDLDLKVQHASLARLVRYRYEPQPLESPDVLASHISRRKPFRVDRRCRPCLVTHKIGAR
jgi:hypothetical protein